MKKTVSFLLVLCSLVLLVSGCTDSKSNPVKSGLPTDGTMSPDLNTTQSNSPTPTPTETPNLSQTPEFLFEDENWGYYADENIRDIIKVSKKDPNESSVILNYKDLLEYEGHWIRDLCIIDDLMIFRLCFTFYIYDLKTQSLSDAYVDARQFRIVGKDIYYCGRMCTLYKMNVYDTEPTEIFKSDISGNDKSEWKNLFKNFIFIGDVMYYYQRNPDGLYRYENGVSTLIDDNERIDEFSLFESDGKLYYTTKRTIEWPETEELFEYDPVKNKVTVLCECPDCYGGEKIENGIFYYQNSDDETVSIKLWDV